MGRWLVGVLIVANLAYAGWHFGVGALPATPSVSVAPVVPASAVLQIVDAQAGEQSPLQETATAELCATLEYWSKRGDALVARQRLGTLGKQARVEQVSLDMDLGWVYLPPFADREQAEKALAKLHDKAIDSFIIAEGEQKNGISLGVFRDHHSALALKNALQQKGINAQMTDTRRQVTEYRLVLGHVNAVALASQLKRMPGIESRWRSCSK